MRKGYLSMGLRSNWYQIGNKTCYKPKLANFMQKKDILKTLKRSSLAYQCIFYRPEENTEGGPSRYCILKALKCKNEINKRIVLKEQMKKMRSFVQLWCLLSELWSLKCQKWFIFFLLMPAKNQSQFGENIYVHLKDLNQLFQKMLRIVGF